MSLFCSSSWCTLYMDQRKDQWKMVKVPLLMRGENKESNEDYEPKVVSFGPYHYGKEKLKLVEDFRCTAIKMFIGKGGRDELDYLDRILSDIDYVRSCYLEESTFGYTNQELTQMMFRDGCVILNYIGPMEKERSHKKAQTINEHLGTAIYNSIRRDMYLLENQVPLRILEILVELRYGTSKEEFIKNMETYFFKRFFEDEKGIIVEAPNKYNNLGQTSFHLLEIFRRVIVTGKDHDPEDDTSRNTNKVLLDIERGCRGCCKDDEDETIPGRYVFRSVTDLKSKGINLRASKIKSLKGVRFSPTRFCRSAELKLPHLYVDMYTRVFFKNIIAYELAPYEQIPDKSVTAYVSFMKLLVDTTEDVKELRENKIIINKLGSDDDVVKLYQDLNTYEAEDSSNYKHVKEYLERHYNCTIKMWMANLTTTYFSKTWTTTALAASVVFLWLDIVQTYYAANPKN